MPDISSNISSDTSSDITAASEAGAQAPSADAARGDCLLDARGRLVVGRGGFNTYLVHTRLGQKLDLVLGDRCKSICEMSLTTGLRSTRYDSCNDEGSSTLTVAAASMGTHWVALRHCIKSGSDPDFAVRISAQESVVASCTGALAILPACEQTQQFCVRVKCGQALALWVYASRDQIAHAEGEVWSVEPHSRMHVARGSWAANEHGRGCRQHGWDAEMVQHIEVALSHVGVHVLELHCAAAAARAVVRVTVRPTRDACKCTRVHGASQRV
jgi:hypothetical protein